MNDRFHHTVNKFDYSLGKIRDPDPIARDCALDSVFMYVYRLREFWKKELGDHSYYAAAEASDIGHVTEAVVMVRGVAEHHLSRIISPQMFGLYPGARTYPGRWTFPGENLTWLSLADTGEAFAGKRAEVVSAYERYLAGMIVGYTFDNARFFLVESGLGQ